MSNKKLFPLSENRSIIIRLDFSMDEIYEKIKTEIINNYPKEYGTMPVTFLEDSYYKTIPISSFLDLVPKDWNHAHLFIIDEKTISHPEHPLLCLDMFEFGVSFRLLPKTVYNIDVNLSMAKIDFDDIISNQEEDKIHRGYE